MGMQQPEATAGILAPLAALSPDAEQLQAAGFEVTTGVGQTGVVGLLRNGDGPVVMLRADMDALPIKEATGLPYASKETATDDEGNAVPVMHACGHDMHVAWLAGAANVLARARNAWLRDGDSDLSAGGGDGRGRPGDDRRWTLRPLPEARRRAWAARHAGAGGHDRVAPRRRHVRRR